MCLYETENQAWCSLRLGRKCSFSLVSKLNGMLLVLIFSTTYMCHRVVTVIQKWLSLHQ